jgi:D-alanine-D-alanine ligase
MDKDMLKSKKIGVLMGGKSSERDVSLKSGTAIARGLKTLGYNVASIDTAGDLCALLKRNKVDVAFIALHGGHGENGAVQGLLEILNIPYTGSGIIASAMAMDKEASKKIFAYHAVPVPAFRILRAGISPSPSLRMPFPLPWVVKPAAEGSSIGVEIVRKRGGLPEALKQAFSYGDRVIVEQYIGGKEVQIGILNDRVLGAVEVRPSLEFYNYQAKYTSGLTEYILPPEISRKSYEKACTAALSAHQALGCSGATRVDLIIAGTGSPFVLEVNTIPGMTETSLLPKIARTAGLEFPSLLEEILGGVRA